MTSPEEVTRCLVLRPLKDFSPEQSHKFQNFTNQSTGRHNIRSRISSRNWRTLGEKRPVSGCLFIVTLLQARQREAKLKRIPGMTVIPEIERIRV